MILIGNRLWLCNQGFKSFQRVKGFPQTYDNTFIKKFYKNVFGEFSLVKWIEPVPLTLKV